MADPVKPLDPRKPFRRINNERFLVKDPPSGDGVARGCLIPENFGDVEEEFKELIKEVMGADKVLDVINKVLKGIRTVLDAIDFVSMILRAGAKALEDMQNPALAPFILLLRGAAALVDFLNPLSNVITRTVNTILKMVEDAIHSFFELIGRKVLRRAMRLTPQWVPVRGQGASDIVVPDEIVEVEGIATNSFGNPIDAPFLNWHFWFNWNIQVKPEPQYEKLLVPGLPNPAQRDQKHQGDPAVLRDGSIEIQWDAGALASARDPYLNGFDENRIAAEDGPITNLLDCWPMAGMYVWAAGRWVYDCSQATEGKEPRMRTMINPPKALATARWQAFQFEENTHPVPAIQFMFLTKASGGYISYPDLGGEDYEFILDLPANDAASAPFPIGHRSEFAHNTIVVRPRLLMKVQELAGTGARLVEPVVRPIPGDGPAALPRQVRVKIPGAALQGGGAGFLLSLGWFDPNLELARKVRVCSLVVTGFTPHVKRENTGQLLKETFGEEIDTLRTKLRDEVLDLEIIDINKLIPLPFSLVIKVRDVDNLLGHTIRDAIDGVFDALINGIAELIPSGEDEWLLRFGFNGTWRSHFQLVQKAGVPIQFAVRPSGAPGQESLHEKFEFRNRMITEGDPLFFSSCGMEFQPVGDIMHSPEANRTITLDGRSVRWSHIVKAPPGVDPKAHRRKLVFQVVKKLMIDTTGGVTKLSLGMDNFPLGIIAPEPGAAPSDPRSNPMTVGPAVTGSTVAREARLVSAIGDQMLLVEERTLDYTITYRLEVSELLKAAG